MRINAVFLLVSLTIQRQRHPSFDWGDVSANGAVMQVCRLNCSMRSIYLLIFHKTFNLRFRAIMSASNSD